MKKNRIIAMLALLTMAAAGALAQDTYTITAKVNVNDTWGEEKTLFDAETLPKTTTLKDCYKAAMGGDVPPFCVYQSAEVVSGENYITLGDDNGWDTEINITDIGEGIISIQASISGTQVEVQIDICAARNATKGEGNSWTYTHDFNSHAEITVYYYPRATLATAPEPITDPKPRATTIDPLVSEGTANGGAVCYAIGTSDTSAPTDGWSTDVPTAKSMTGEGTAYVWYKVVGDDTHSDGEMAPACLAVEVKGEPHREDIYISAEKDEDKWVVSPESAAEREIVTITYNGTMKVKEVFGEPFVKTIHARVDDGLGTVVDYEIPKVKNGIFQGVLGIEKEGNVQKKKLKFLVNKGGERPDLWFGGCFDEHCYNQTDNDGEFSVNDIEFIPTWDDERQYGITVRVNMREFNASEKTGMKFTIYNIPDVPEISDDPTTNDAVDGFYATPGSTANTWTYKQAPWDGDITLKVNYYDYATLSTAPAAIEGIEPNTNSALVSAGTATGGTIYYAIGTSDTSAPTEGWSTDVPTAESITESGIVYVWYKVVGDDTHNDLEPVCLAVEVSIPEITLTEDEGLTTDINDTWKGFEVGIKFKRTFDALTDGATGKASTVCLPFDFDNPNAGIFATFGGVTKTGDEYIVTMNEVTGDVLTAGVPYLFKPTAGGEVTFKRSEYRVPEGGFTPAGTATDDAGWQFTGTYNKMEWESGQTRLYGFAAADFKESGVQIGESEIGVFKRYDYGYCNAFRCFLWAPEPSGARAVSGSNITLPESMRVILLKTDGTATDIGTLDTRTGEINVGKEWFDLGGRKIDGKPAKKGVYINNGKKIKME